MADIERHAQLKILGKPKLLDSHYANALVESILKTKLKYKSKLAVAVKVEQDATLSIVKIKKIHPPAHLVVVSDEYQQYGSLKSEMKDAPIFRGYYSPKS